MPGGSNAVADCDRVNRHNQKELAVLAVLTGALDLRDAQTRRQGPAGHRPDRCRAPTPPLLIKCGDENHGPFG